MILKTCEYKTRENVVDLFTEVEINGTKNKVKFKTFIFNEKISEIIDKDEKSLLNLITEENMTIEISEEDYELIKRGTLSLPCVVIDLTKKKEDQIDNLF